MSNHIADANKMVSDTPRTNAESFFPHDSKYQVCDADFCRQLERELNAANERIQSLIEERGRANRLAEWKWSLRGEFESLLGTDNIEEGIKAVKALMERIKRLEEAGDAMAIYAELGGIPLQFVGVVNAWREAKEVKL